MYITDEEIQDIIQNHRRLLDEIEKARDLICCDLMNTDEQIQSLALKSQQFRETVVSPTHAYKDGIFDVLEKQKVMQIELQKDRTQRLRDLIEKEDYINRIWSCFLLLEQYNAHGFRILHMLYIENKLWEAVKAEMRISKNRMVSIRKEAYEWIRTLSSQECENNELARYAKKPMLIKKEGVRTV